MRIPAPSVCPQGPTLSRSQATKQANTLSPGVGQTGEGCFFFMSGVGYFSGNLTETTGFGSPTRATGLKPGDSHTKESHCSIQGNN